MFTTAVFLNIFVDVSFGQYIVYQIHFDCNHGHSN